MPETYNGLNPVGKAVLLPTLPSTCEVPSSETSPIVEKTAYCFDSTNTGAAGPVGNGAVIFTGKYAFKPMSPLLTVTSPLIVSALPSRSLPTDMDIDPPAIIVPFMMVLAPILTAPVTYQNTLDACAPLINLTCAFTLVLKAYTGGPAGILKMNTAFGFPCASKMMLLFSEVAPGNW